MIYPYQSFAAMEICDIEEHNSATKPKKIDHFKEFKESKCSPHEIHLF